MLQAYREYIPCASHATRASDRSQSNTVFNGFGFMHVAIFQSIWHRHEAGQDDTRVRSQPMCNITRALKVVQECAVSLCAILREPWGWYYKSVHLSKCATLQECALIQVYGITRVCTDPSVRHYKSMHWSKCAAIQECAPIILKSGYQYASLFSGC